MIKLSNKEFDSIFNLYKKIEIAIEYGRNGELRIPYRTASIYNNVFMYKLTEKQVNKMIDYAFSNSEKMEEVMRLMILFSEKDLLKNNIPLASYEYFIQKLLEINYRLYEDILFDVLYFKTKDYDDIKRSKKENDLVEMTLKYLDKFEFVKKTTIESIFFNTRDRDYIYRGYTNSLEFNSWLVAFSEDTPINPDDFKLKDDIGDFLWREKNP